VFFSRGGQFGQIRKKSLFQKQKFEIGFLDLYIHGKLYIIPFWSMSQKLWGLLVCGQFRILYFKINFEVIYLIQVSIFLEKNKIVGCRVFITTLWTFGLEFFNSIINFSTIKCSASFYFILFFYMLYNSKWPEFFQACIQPALKNESKE